MSAFRRPAQTALPRASRGGGGAPLYYWPLWLLSLGVALVIFYGVLTPIWMLVRLVAWVSERPVFKRGL